MARVAFERVDKVYPGGVCAIAGLTLEVADGELMVVVGPSGCGKSTLLRLVAGLEEPTSGTVKIGDRAVNGLRPQQRNVAMVFQDYALYPYMSARKNIEFPLKMRRLPRAEIRARVERVARLLEIEPLLDVLPKHLSGGQRQRVAMGRALVRDPSVFLLDEPLSNLDARLRVQVRAEIKELQRRTETTMIYVTHDQVEAMTLGDRVAVLHQGRLQQVATPRELYERPANVFVAGFIGSPPMNLFPATVEDASEARVSVRIGDAVLPIPGTRLRGVPQLAGRRVTAGIRPEAVGVEAAGSTGASVEGRVGDMENLGHESLAYLRLGAAEALGAAVRVIARVAGMISFAPGERCAVRFDPERLYLFDERGESLVV